MFVGDRSSNGEKVEGTLVVCRNNGTREVEVPAISGPSGNGAISDGVYIVHAPYRALTGEGHCGCKKEGGSGSCCVNPFDFSIRSCWFALITNTPGRWGLGIHPDGGNPGTAGCIGVNTGYADEIYDRLSLGGDTMALIVDTDPRDPDNDKKPYNQPGDPCKTRDW